MGLDLGLLFFGPPKSVERREAKPRQTASATLLPPMTEREAECERLTLEADRQESELLRRTSEVLDQHHELLAKSIVDSSPSSAEGDDDEDDKDH